MSVIRFTVPGKPVGVNRQYRRGATGQVFKTDEARWFGAMVAQRGLAARRRARLQAITGPVDVLITFYFESERPDGDGPVKTVLDALQVMDARARRLGAGIVLNDRQVRDHHVRRRVDREKPRVEVVVGSAGEVFTLSELVEQEVG